MPKTNDPMANEAAANITGPAAKKSRIPVWQNNEMLQQAASANSAPTKTKASPVDALPKAEPVAEKKVEEVVSAKPPFLRKALHFIDMPIVRPFGFSIRIYHVVLLAIATIAFFAFRGGGSAEDTAAADVPISRSIVVDEATLLCSTTDKATCGSSPAAIGMKVLIQPMNDEWAEVRSADGATLLAYTPLTDSANAEGDGGVTDAGNEGFKLPDVASPVDLSGYAPELNLPKVKINTQEYTTIVRLLYMSGNWKISLVEFIVMLLIAFLPAYEYHKQFGGAATKEHQQSNADIWSARLSAYIVAIAATFVVFLLLHLLKHSVLDGLISWTYSKWGWTDTRIWVNVILWVLLSAGFLWFQRELYMTGEPEPVVNSKMSTESFATLGEAQSWYKNMAGKAKFKNQAEEGEPFNIYGANPGTSFLPVKVEFWRYHDKGVRRDISRNVAYTAIAWYFSQLFAPGALINAIDIWDILALVAMVWAFFEAYNEFGANPTKFVTVIAAEIGIAFLVFKSMKGFGFESYPGILPFFGPPLFANAIRATNDIGEGILDLCLLVCVTGLVVAEINPNVVFGLMGAG